MLGVSASVDSPAGRELTRKLTGRTVNDSIHEGQRRIAGAAPRLEAAMNAVTNLPEGIQKEWEGYLKTLEGLTTVKNVHDSEGDPIAIIRYINNIRPRIQELRKVGSAERRPDARRAINIVISTFDAYDKSIGPTIHSAVITRDPRAWMRDSSVSKRSGELLQTGFGLIGVAGTLIAGTTALMSEKMNLTLPLIFLGGTFLVTSDLRRGATAKLGDQVGWLTDIGGDWETLQTQYGIRGPDWTSFASHFVEGGSTNETITTMLTSKTKPTEEQIKAVLALAPASIHPKLRAMIATNKNNTPAYDLRRFIELLQRPQSDDARGITLAFVRSGASGRSLRMLAPGARGSTPLSA